MKGYLFVKYVGLSMSQIPSVDETKYFLKRLLKKKCIITSTNSKIVMEHIVTNAHTVRNRRTW